MSPCDIMGQKHLQKEEKDNTKQVIIWIDEHITDISPDVYLMCFREEFSLKVKLTWAFSAYVCDALGEF